MREWPAALEAEYPGAKAKLQRLEMDRILMMAPPPFDFKIVQRR